MQLALIDVFKHKYIKRKNEGVISDDSVLITGNVANEIKSFPNPRQAEINKLLNLFSSLHKQTNQAQDQ